MKQDQNQAHRKTTDADHNPAAGAKGSELKRLWIELLKTAVFVLGAFTVIVMGCIAWFAANNTVRGEGLAVSAREQVVRIAAMGVRQNPEQNLLNLDDGVTYPYEENIYHYTDGGTIALRLSEPDIAVSPGARGSVTFYIIPTRDGSMTVRLHLGLAGYEDCTTDDVPSAKRADDPILDALLSGHILLFGGYDGQYFSDWLGSGSGTGNSITISRSGAKEGVPIPVTIHWIWPLRYENMVEDLYSPADGEEAAEFRTFVENQTINMTPISETNYCYSRIFLTNAELLSKASRSKAYDLADEYIGTNANYLYLTIQTTAFEKETP